jgi:hypothetical protein
MIAKFPTDPNAEHSRFQITMETDTPDGCPFNVGDMVTFTNENGVVFEHHKVVGFTLPGDDLHGRNVYINVDCYWMPMSVDSLTFEPDTTDSQIQVNDPCLAGCGLGFNL